MIDICGSIAGHIGSLFQCTEINGVTRVRSPFMYPDGDYVDIFVREKDGPVYTVTDFGEAGRWLRMQSASLRRSPKQTALILDTCQTHGVEWFSGMIVARAASPLELPSTVLKVSQAAMRVSDLWFTFRQRVAESIVEDVAAVLTEARVPFERNQALVGRSQKSWRVDFHTRGKSKSALVGVLSTGSRAAAQTMVKHIVAAWYDLSYIRLGPDPLAFVTLFDDTSDVWSAEDFALVSDLSEVSYWSHPEDFVEKLAA